MEGSEAKGVKFKVFGLRIRIWKFGFEYGKNGHGRIRFFPWAPLKPRYDK